MAPRIIKHLREYAWLYALLMVALVLDFLFFTGYYAYDDKDYAWAALKLVRGEPFLHPRSENYEIAAIRLAITLPLAVVAWLTNASITWMAASHTLYHLGGVVVAYFLGRRAHSESAGRVAAALVAINPIFYLYAGILYPDDAIAMWSALSMLLVLRAIDLQAIGSIGRRFGGFFLAGFVTGVAYSCKPIALMLVVPAAICIIAASPSLRRPRWIIHGTFMALGLLSFMALELLLLGLLGGEWISQLTLAYDSTSWDFPVWAARQGYWPHQRLIHGVATLAVHMPITVWLLLGGPALYPFMRGRKPLVAIYFWWCFLFLTIGSTSLHHYLPPPIFTRYYTLIIIPAACAAGHVVVSLCRRLLAWQKRPAWLRASNLPRILVACGLVITVCEVARNQRYGGTLGNAAWARSFVRAYEIANREYPEYPIVLSEEITYTLLPLLEPDIPSHVYSYAAGLPWGIPRRPLPEPPFLFIDWTRPSTRSGLHRLTGEKLALENLQIVYPESPGALTRLGVAWNVLVAGEPRNDRPPDRLHDATVIQLVTKPIDNATPGDARMALAPLFARGDQRVTVRVEPDRAVIRWPGATPFTLHYFDDGSTDRAPSSPQASMGRRARANFTLVARAASYHPAAIRAEVTAIAYDKEGKVITSLSQPVQIQQGAIEVPLEFHCDRPAQTFRLIWSVTPGPGAGAMRLEPIVIIKN